MTEEIKKVQIFLVTKNEREDNEYLELCNFADAINQKLQKAYHLKTDLITADDSDAPERKQEEYRKQMCESDAVFFIISINPDEAMRLDFVKVSEHFREEGRPAVYTYFYKAEGKDHSPDVLSFMSEPDRETGHFCSVFEHIDAVKLRILMQLKSNDPDMAKMSFRNVRLILDGSEVMSLRNVKMVAENSSLKYWYGELVKTEKDYFAVKALHAENKSDENLCIRYEELDSERSCILEKTEETEQMLFEMYMNLIKDFNRGEMTSRQKEAYRLFEDGNPEGAYAVLDFNEMTSEYHRELETGKQEAKKLASRHIRELRSKIDIAESMTNYKKQIADITECSEEIMSASLEYGTEYDSVRQYAVFLYNYVSASKACEVLKILEGVYDNGNADAIELAEFYDTAGRITYHIPGKQDEAGEYFVKAADVREKLAEKDPERYEPDLACRYNYAGNLYCKQGHHKKAEEFYLKAVDIREKLAERNPDRYEPDLACSYNNAGVFYDNQGQGKKAEEFYLKAVGITEKLAEKNPDRYGSDLAKKYNDVSFFCNNQGQSRKAEEFCLKAVDILEKLAEKNPEWYGPDLAKNYNNTGLFYTKQRQTKKAEEFYLKAADIWEKLAEENPDQYGPGLAYSYKNAGAFYNGHGQSKKAEEYYIKAVNIWEKLAEKNPAQYEPDLAGSYNHIGAFYSGQGQSRKAEEFLLKAAAIWEKLAEDNPDRYESDLAFSYNLIGAFYNGLGQSRKAEEFLLKSADIWEKLAERNPDRYEYDLANSYNHVGAFYNDHGQSKKAEDYYLKSVDILEKLAEKNPDRYEPNLAMSCFNYGNFSNDGDYLERARLAAEKHPENTLCSKILEQI